MAVIVAKSEGQVARPLSVLVPLIKKDLDAARDASERAGTPYYQAAGEKMIEAKGQLKQGEFVPWIKHNFNLSAPQARRYMEFARATSSMQNEGSPSFSSLNDFHRQTGSSAYRSVTSKRDWHEGVKESIDHAKREAKRAREENLTRQQEREADQKLALRLIEIGFKVLAKELHPDRGGSREAMTRLNRVRDRLKQCA